MLSINDLHPGIAIVFNGQPHIVIRREHSMLGRGGGFVRTKLKNLVSGATIENTFKGNDRLAEADLERSRAQFLYQENDRSRFMDTTSFEQFSLPRSEINGEVFLTEGLTVDVVSYRGRPITVALPLKVDLKVAYTEPGFKGNTTTAATKSARLETGADIQVPLFIEMGDTIRVDTRTGAYLERIKK